MSRPRPCGGWPGGGSSGRAGGRSGPARIGTARRRSWPATPSPTPPGGRCGPKTSSKTAVRDLGVPLILKTASSGYDGKGQVLVDRAADAGPAWASLGRVACVAEGWVEFAAELSVVVVRGRDGYAVAYPVGLNHHERHILATTVMPAPVGPIVALEARTLALAVAQALDAVGVLSVEFFLTAGGRLLVNEIAPRPHNSGH